MIAKHDSYDPDEDVNNIEDQQTKTLFGFVWEPVKGLSICPNLTETSTYDANGVEVDTDMSAVNFQFKF